LRTIVWLALSAFLLSGCKKDKKEEAPLSTPPPRGMASSQELSVGIGQARALPEGLTPSSTRWTHVTVLDDKRAVITGEVLTESILLVTDDAGKTWRTLRYDNENGSWSNLSVGSDGTMVLAVGARDGARDATSATVEATRLLFTNFEQTEFTPPMPLFPQPNGPVKGLLQTVAASPAVLSSDTAALVVEEAPRRQAIFYGGRPDANSVPPLKLPPTEKIIPAPFGRPPSLLSTRGRDLLIRPFPAAGKPLDPPKKVPGVVATPTLGAELSAPPACDAKEWSFQRVKQPPARSLLLGVSASRTIAFTLPDTTSPTTRIGCSTDHIVVETADPKTKIPQLALCDLEGHCVTPQNNPFRIWPEEHTRTIVSVPADKGVVSVLSSRAGERWGLYLAQATDGTMYEQVRVIGEGQSDRGRLDVGAMVSFGARVVLLLSADVTGTSRRGWFVIASDDGGTSWNPP